MFNAITHSHIWVFDQDQALDFYVGKLGLEVRADVDLEVMRWLTVGVPGEPGREILLEVPGPPGMDPASAAETRDLVAKGATGLNAIFTTEDCQATFEDLRDRNVEITQEPVERFYGIDMGIRDPFGNHLRVTQPAPVPAGGWPSDVKVAEF